MRMIGHVSNEPDAHILSDYLYVRGIDNQIEFDRGSGWAVWVHAEDEIESAKRHLQEFLYDPVRSKFSGAREEALRRRQQEDANKEELARRSFDAGRLFARPGVLGMTIVTSVLFFVCIAVFIVAQIPEVWERVQPVLQISRYRMGNTPLERVTRGLVEIKQGQVWRLVTPAFMHFGIIHIFFNLLWLKDLGTLLESRRGSYYLLAFVLLVAAVSNLGQIVFSDGDPRFGGMSGVVYGLLGFVWMKGKLDPSSGFFLDPTTITMMLIWLVFGYTGIMPIANGAHTVGLLAGMAWGSASALRRV